MENPNTNQENQLNQQDQPGQPTAEELWESAEYMGSSQPEKNIPDSPNPSDDWPKFEGKIADQEPVPIRPEQVSNQEQVDQLVDQAVEEIEIGSKNIANDPVLAHEDAGKPGFLEKVKKIKDKALQKINKLGSGKKSKIEQPSQPAEQPQISETEVPVSTPIDQEAFRARQQAKQEADAAFSQMKARQAEAIAQARAEQAAKPKEELFNYQSVPPTRESSYGSQVSDKEYDYPKDKYVDEQGNVWLSQKDAEWAAKESAAGFRDLPWKRKKAQQESQPVSEPTDQPEQPVQPQQENQPTESEPVQTQTEQQPETGHQTELEQQPEPLGETMPAQTGAEEQIPLATYEEQLEEIQKINAEADKAQTEELDETGQAWESFIQRQAAEQVGNKEDELDETGQAWQSYIEREETPLVKDDAVDIEKISQAQEKESGEFTESDIELGFKVVDKLAEEIAPQVSKEKNVQAVQDKQLVKDLQKLYKKITGGVFDFDSQGLASKDRIIQAMEQTISAKLEEADDFEQLFKVLNSFSGIRSLSKEVGYRDNQYWKSLIEQVRQGSSKLGQITRTYGLRAKVEELMAKQK